MTRVAEVLETLPLGVRLRVTNPVVLAVLASVVLNLALNELPRRARR